MADPIHKILILLKRRPGMTAEEFREYYENRHRKVVDKYLQGVRKYVRRYLDPLPHPDTREITEPEYDVITELWFDRKEAVDGIIAMLRHGRLPDEVIEDEKRVFDRPKTRYVYAIEFEG